MTKAMLILVTGGARSGKSAYAQRTALSFGERPIYVATAKRYADAEFQQRIARHRADRDERWTTIEEPVNISAHDLQKKVVVVDCVTLWLTNLFALHHYQVEPSLEAVRREVENFLATDATFVLVTNELGMGLHAETETGRQFTDLQGWANQFIAGKADRVVFMVSGIPLILKNNR